MTELDVPPDADEDEAAALVREFLTVGDVVEVWDRDRTDADDPAHEGTVTGFDPAYLELDGESAEGKSFRYDELDTVIRVEMADQR